jgi:hypothetical protein
MAAANPNGDGFTPERTPLEARLLDAADLLADARGDAAIEADQEVDFRVRAVLQEREEALHQASLAVEEAARELAALRQRCEAAERGQSKAQRLHTLALAAIESADDEADRLQQENDRLRTALNECVTIFRGIEAHTALSKDAALVRIRRRAQAGIEAATLRSPTEEGNSNA